MIEVWQNQPHACKFRGARCTGNKPCYNGDDSCGAQECPACLYCEKPTDVNERRIQDATEAVRCARRTPARSTRVRMRVSDIVEGGVYQSRGMCYISLVHDCTLPAKMPDGRVFHTPNRCCSIKYFARWAREKVWSGHVCAVTPIVHPAARPEATRAARSAAYGPTMAMSTVMGNRQDQA